ncbi:hypothetical protein [Occallatibacter riparius]|uniref:Uncharacterized protein n=1 Tax=Occallatibacter riparius TaxID=1002689 RepID=A0A9J7BPI6_9BACT|nr:hypothetical protein [Occallatibacter riparius]UWZ84624.1 hypothetical protein MOP44_01515 [Occallatibacter riparius]
MSTAGNRDQDSGNIFSYVPAMTCKCAVAGCGRMAFPGERFCERCLDEISALVWMSQQRDERETMRAQRLAKLRNACKTWRAVGLYYAAIRFEYACVWLHKWRWRFLAAVVLAALMCFFGDLLGTAFEMWMTGGRNERRSADLQPFPEL